MSSRLLKHLSILVGLQSNYTLDEFEEDFDFDLEDKDKINMDIILPMSHSKKVQSQVIFPKKTFSSPSSREKEVNFSAKTMRMINDAQIAKSRTKKLDPIHYFSPKVIMTSKIIL